MNSSDRHAGNQGSALVLGCSAEDTGCHRLSGGRVGGKVHYGNSQQQHSYRRYSLLKHCSAPFEVIVQDMEVSKN
jgi:hypothetical protein